MQLHRRAEDLEARRTCVLLISFSGADEARRWRAETGVGFQLLLDASRSVYRAYGLERSLLRSWSLPTLRYYLSALRRGERLRPSRSDPHQLGGDFVVDGEGVIRLAYRSRDPVDRPPVDLLLDAVRPPPPEE